MQGHHTHIPQRSPSLIAEVELRKESSYEESPMIRLFASLKIIWGHLASRVTDCLQQLMYATADIESTLPQLPITMIYYPSRIE